MSTDGVIGRLRRMFGPTCPECGRRTTKPETPSSPIWLCATCGLRYLPSSVGSGPARSTKVKPFRRR
jgi:ribosomal protein L37AE/L43A